MKFDRDIVLAELSRFVQPVALIDTPAVACPGVAVPAQWLRFIEQQMEPNLLLLAEWDVISPDLPKIAEFLEASLQRVSLLKEANGATSLLYQYTTGGQLNFSRGRPPLSHVPERLAPLWDRVPARLRDFHTRLHDGWTFLPANSMGPLPVADWAFLSDDRFDIDEETASAMSIDIARVAAVFHNGGGDYLCLNFADSLAPEATGLIWWHEDPANPEPVDFWGVLDAWVGIFLEEADWRGQTS
ncbi:SMI1/KNR4 family protein [Pseudoduganella plicata]|uniref:SMI1/KNR4 family protein n=1 Tax=Pseudoduganella plicata TaxID=321984 RepID=A0A4P7BC73_9BURK|nr:SMI1/KNR4 family protein [Pseudoduganella plicata]QBQ35487.1 SMI1/KNR4 family protein [Pseudoduganella plicata]GGZ02141.1 hypothetical protein GCM10007388_39920 [Pseudoduganella plicata]